MKRNEGSNYYSLNRRTPAAERVVQAASATVTPEQEYEQLKK